MTTTINYSSASLEAFSGPQLVEAYNNLGPEKPVKRFSDRKAAIRRILSLQGEQVADSIEPTNPDPPTPKPSPSKRVPVEPKSKSQERRLEHQDGKQIRGERKPKARKPFDCPFTGTVKPYREGTKRALVINMLKSGATFEEIMGATEWNHRTAYDGIKLIHTSVGYGLSESSTGVIRLVTK